MAHSSKIRENFAECYNLENNGANCLSYIENNELGKVDDKIQAKILKQF